MRQRVAFLRTLLSGKPVLCLDEPFGALDAITRAEMQEWLAQALAREPRTVVLVTHDVEEAIAAGRPRRRALAAARAGWSPSSRCALPRPRVRTDAPWSACASARSRSARRRVRRGRRRMSARLPAALQRSARVAAPRRLAAVLPPALLVLALLGVWELYVDAGSTSSFVLPAPHAVASALWNNAGFLAAQPRADRRGGRARDRDWRWRSASRWPCAIHFSPLLRRAVYPLAVGSQAMPIAVIAPLLVFWWGFGVLPKLVVIVADLLLPGARHDRRRARAPSTPSSSSCCARSTPRAGRRSASPSCRRRCRRRSAARGSRSRSA